MKSIYSVKVYVLFSIAALALICHLTGCGNTTQTQENNVIDTTNAMVDISTLTKIADTTLTDSKINLYVQDSLTNKNEIIYFQITDLDDNPITQAQITYDIDMDMGMMSHAGPYYPLVDLGNGLYKAEVVFIMANMNNMGKGWMINAVLDKKDSISFLLPVSEAQYARTLSVGTKDDSRVFVSLILPSEVEVGKRTIDFTLHKIDHDLFPPLDQYTIEVEPFMPDMGHGSPNNEAAESIGNGRYSGVVNFTMRGAWTIKVNLFKNGEKVSHEELAFPIEVK